MELKSPPEFVHSSCELLREHIHSVLVRPEYGGNVGSAARALANMGIRGSLNIVGESSILDAAAWRMAKHAKRRLEQARFFTSLPQALQVGPRPLVLAATARVGSPRRPHPLSVGVAVERATRKLFSEEVSDIVFVFGPEADGLQNEEVDCCDWVVTIPTSDEYRSLNLAQAVLVFSYEVNGRFPSLLPGFDSRGRSQRDKLIAHFLRLAEEAGFILPGDPYKMRPRLEEIFSQLPSHWKEAKTVHGLLEQAICSIRAGHPEFKGRYRRRMNEGTAERRVKR